MANRIVPDRYGGINIGKLKENLVTEVNLPAPGFAGGSYAVLLQRPEEKQPYPVSVRHDGRNLVWTVQTADTAISGIGKLECRWYGDNGEVAKSQIYTVRITDGLPDPTEAPEAWAGFLQQVSQDAGRAETAANTAQGAAAAAKNVQQSVGPLASQVRGDADRVTTDKAEAQKAAGDALESQQEAGRQATTAQEAATSARAAANRAADSKGQAETARVGAEEAKAKAEKAAQEAQDAQKTAVLYTEQQLTDSQKEQARTNINAADKARQNVLVGTETGNPIAVDDAFSAPLCGLTVYGKSTQDGTPTPDAPVPIVSAGDGGSVAVTLSDGNDKTQTLTLPTPNGLPGIPVRSGGNYTDQSGQQWVCDEVDLGRGVKVQMVNAIDLSTRNVTAITKFEVTKRLSIRLPILGRDYNTEALCSGLPFLVSFSKDTLHFYVDKTNAQIFIPIDAKNPEEGEYILFYALATPIETPLTPAEIATYKALITYAPDTVVQVSDGAGLKLDYQRDVNIVIKNLEDAIASMTAT